MRSDVGLSFGQAERRGVLAALLALDGGRPVARAVYLGTLTVPPRTDAFPWTRFEHRHDDVVIAGTADWGDVLDLLHAHDALRRGLRGRR